MLAGINIGDLKLHLVEIVNNVNCCFNISHPSLFP